MSSIATVRATLSTLSVPSPNAPPSDLASTVAKSSMCKAQYGDARNKYLRQRVEEQMVDYVGTWDDEKGEFQQPEQHDDPNNGDLVESVVAVAKEICNIQSDLDARRGTFEVKKAELNTVISEMDVDSDPMDDADGGGDDDDDDMGEVDEDAISQDIEAATKRRDELRARLAEVQKGISAAQADLAESLATITEGGGDKSVLENAAPAGDIVKDAEALKAKLAKQAQESEWYEAVRTAMEQLSGISVTSIAATKAGMLCTLSLSGTHTLSVAMRKGPGGVKVDDAVLKGPPISDDLGIVTCALPGLTDLVAACVAMKAPSDLRFVIREAAARMRNSVLKTAHVGLLRKRHEIKGNEALDSLDVNLSGGVKAQVTLTVDYPTCVGSCYVTSLTSSTGTLAQEDLDKVRADVNERRGEHVLGVVEDVEKGVREVALNGVGAGLGLGGLLPR